MTENDWSSKNSVEKHHHHKHHHRHHRHHHMRRGWKIFWSIFGVLVAILLIFAGVAYHNLSVTTGDMYSTSGANTKRNAQKQTKISSEIFNRRIKNFTTFVLESSYSKLTCRKVL